MVMLANMLTLVNCNLKDQEVKLEISGPYPIRFYDKEIELLVSRPGTPGVSG